MRPIQCHTLRSMILVIDCEGLNRDDGLDLSQLMTLLFPSCPYMKWYLVKESLRTLVPSMQGTQMMKGVSNALV